MIGVKLICAGGLKEKFYIDAFSEYKKRLSGYCRFTCQELNEIRLPENPAQADIERALKKEGEEIRKNIPKGFFTVAMCIEGRCLDSLELAEIFSQRAMSGKPNLCFLIGSSYGLDPELKKSADLRLSMSPMTFPHHLARIMLLEQIYRAFKINEGSKYHK